MRYSNTLGDPGLHSAATLDVTSFTELSGPAIREAGCSRDSAVSGKVGTDPPRSDCIRAPTDGAGETRGQYPAGKKNTQNKSGTRQNHGELNT